MSDLIVIPARYGSTRLPGKPLLTIAGRSLLERVLDVARQAASGLGGVGIAVATDDARIAAHAEALGCLAVMTGSGISSGTGRALAAAQALGRRPAVVLNLQGDAPFVPVEAVRKLLVAARSLPEGMVTPVVPLSWDELDALRAHKQKVPFSGTTCLRGPDGRALWFSKQILPAIRDEAKLRQSSPERSPVLRHLGLYAYAFATLELFEATPPSPYETLEGLEQLRLMELGVPVRTVEIAPPAISMSGIDTAEDIALAEALIARHGDPFRGAPG